MTHDRSPNIPLAADIPRCEPSRECAVRGRCAPYMAAIPDGITARDFSAEPYGGTYLCDGFVALSSVLRPEPRRQRTTP